MGFVNNWPLLVISNSYKDAKGGLNKFLFYRFNDTDYSLYIVDTTFKYVGYYPTAWSTSNKPTLAEKEPVFYF